MPRTITVKIGDEFEVGAWFANLVDQDKAKTAVKAGFRHAETASSVVFGPISWETFEAGGPRVPAPPSTDMKFLVGTARIQAITTRPQVVQRTFIQDLDFVDAQRLRQLTRQAHQARFPDTPPLDDDACDAIIEMIGPGLAEAEIRAAVDRKSLN